jgi:hypothetical protein
MNPLLHRLIDGLTQVEGMYKEAESPPDENAGRSERLAAIGALTEVIKFLNAIGAETNSLARLHEALLDLEQGKSAPMLDAPTPGNRRIDAYNVQTAKAFCAAVYEARRRAGADQKSAATWVLRYMSPALKNLISPKGKPVTQRAIIGWRERWADPGGEPGWGRDRYRFLLEVATTSFKSEKEMSTWFRALPVLGQK